MSDSPVPLPRYDFYQTAEYVIVALYVKGLNAPGVQEHVDIQYQPNEVVILRPAPPGDTDARQRMELGPLYGQIRPESCTTRILSTKLELKLIKSSPINWPTLLSSASSSSPSTAPASGATASSSTASCHAGPSPTGDPTSLSLSEPGSGDFDNIGMAQPRAAHIGGPGKVNSQRKNWDKLVDAELQEKEDSSDPNAGGDAALQKMFSQIYAGADSDTKRAMIKSFTESGGTTLSTDWSQVGKGQVPTRPPDGMEARKY